MNPKWKFKWIKALLSGKYKQGTGYLKRGRYYCCLGVLREVADKNDKSSRQDFLHEINKILSDEQLRKFGLTREIQTELALMNDDKVPFEVIAGFINETL